MMNLGNQFVLTGGHNYPHLPKITHNYLQSAWVAKHIDLYQQLVWKLTQYDIGKCRIGVKHCTSFWTMQTLHPL